MKYELLKLENGKFTTHLFNGDPECLLDEIDRLERNGGIVVKFTDERGQEYFKLIGGKPVV